MEIPFIPLFVAGGSFLRSLFLRPCANELPSTLKPQVNERAVYDWNGRHKAVMERNRSVNPEYAVFGDSLPTAGEGSLPETTGPWGRERRHGKIFSPLIR